MVKRKNGRDVHGILLLNKPTGISSNTALQQAKRLFQAGKAGHTGSLDNLASGLLPICFGEATKLSRFLLEADKRYQAECTLGVTTTTGDAQGEILQTRSIAQLNRKQIDDVTQSFIGTISQIPPMYSALKHQGKALYKWARQGKTIPRQARAIMIYDLIVKRWIDQHLVIEIHCSKGTYVRTLAEDIGEALGCGAHISTLHRLSVGDHREMVDFNTLEQAAQQDWEHLDQLLLPMHTLLSHWPTVTLTQELAHYLRQGQAIQVAHAPTQGWVKLVVTPDHAVMTQWNQFLGIGQILDDGRVAPRRLINL
ncbi:MAG: tRNA pseudouridine(55) synthase TruB [Thioploca sp.]|nr:tRNA pseudouridine(55) synthase TruB [Thioploca sp.]